MNERVRELAIKAGAMEWGDSVVPAMMNIEKFAELLIREFSYDCMDVTDMSHHIVFVAKKWGVEL